MDTILYNGVIHTMAGRTVSALAIQKGRVALAGEDASALALATPETRRIDLEGRCVLPGFTDSHMHMLLTGLGFRRLDLRGVSSVEELVERGRAYVARQSLAPGEWVIGYGFDHNRFPVPVLPDGAAAEAISRDIPVVLDRVCGHVGAANAKALALAGFDEGTVIPGGALDKDPSGRLTGVLREAALDRIKSFAPRLDQSLTEALLEETGRRFAAAGLTAVHSDDLGPEGTDWDTLRAAVDALAARDAMPVRIREEWETPRPPQLRAVLDRGLKSGDGGGWLKLCNIKLIGDGSLGARTAFLRADYADDPGNRGIPVYTQAELDEMVDLCHRGGLQAACHAIGDGACQRFVDAVEKAMAAAPKPLRHRVVHCQIGDTALYRRMAALGMGADVQPPFVPSDAPLVAPRLGEREPSCYAWKSLLEAGVALGGGSDSPVEDFSPLWGSHCAVNRPCGGGPWLPEQRLTPEEAAALYTTGPARLAGEESDLGTLEAGKYADLVVLDRDLFAVPHAEIKDLTVALTMVGGRVTYRRPAR